jgi:hypothetical protein
MQDRKQVQRDQVKQECARRGLKLAPAGLAWRITGPGVSLLCADLSDVSIDSLAPYMPRKQKADVPE